MEAVMEINQVCRKMVRSYTFEVEERLPDSNAQVLGQALIAERGGDLHDLTAPWKMFFEDPGDENRTPDSILEIINTECENLRKKWLSFRKDCPDEQRLNLTTSEPNIQGVVDLITEITNQWRSRQESNRLSKTMARLRRLCGTLNSHRTLMEFLPQGTEYVSLFSGTLNVLIKASISYEQIAEALCEGLLAISEEIEDYYKDLELFKTETMRKMVADLYKHIFQFLGSTLDWIMGKRNARFRHSFNEDYSDKLESQIATIRGKAARIRQEAARSSRAEQRVARLELESLGLGARFDREENIKFHGEMRQMKRVVETQDAEFRKLGFLVRTLLEDKAANELLAKHEPLGTLTDGHPILLPPRSSARIWAASEVRHSSRHLDGFYSPERLQFEGYSPDIQLERTTILRLSEWVAVDSPSILWLEGPYLAKVGSENPITALAAKIAELGRQAGTPVVSYFCQLDWKTALRDSNTYESQEMVALISGLARQMVTMLPPSFTTSCDMSEERFKKIQGSLDSWFELKALLGDLIQNLTNKTLCVIDGLHWLDDRSTNSFLPGLVSTLRSSNLKVLLTTTGRSSALLEELTIEETHSILHSSLQKAGERLLAL